MMQYGDLDGTEQTNYLTYQASRVATPTFIVFIEGTGDVGKYVQEIFTDRAFESLRGYMIPYVGRAYVMVDNEDATFYYSGDSKLKNKKIKIWLGYSDLNIPVFTGYITGVRPVGTTGSYVISCSDNMGYLQEAKVSGHQQDNNTPKLILENFCDNAGLVSNIDSSTETTTAYIDPILEEQTAFNAGGEVALSIFSSIFFDETGELIIKPREYGNKVAWTFDDDNTIEANFLADTNVVNTVAIEHKNDCIVMFKYKESIKKHNPKERVYRCVLIDSVEVSTYTTGGTNECLDQNYEAIKITSSATSNMIDTVRLMLTRDGSSSGNIVVQIFSDENGPGKELGTSRPIQAGELIDGEYSWYTFIFEDPVPILPSVVYWIVIDVTGVNNDAVYVRRSSTKTTGEYAEKVPTTGWALCDDRKGLHQVYGSAPGYRVARDMCNFFGEPRQRVQVAAVGTAQLQLKDEVLCDILDPTIKGHYVVERVRHSVRDVWLSTFELVRYEPTLYSETLVVPAEYSIIFGDGSPGGDT